MKNKIKSFTLAELLVVMIITAIVVGMAFLVLQMVHKQVYKINQNFKKYTDLALFEQKLWQDFNEYSELQFNKSKYTLEMNTEIDSVVYYFDEDYVLRNKDTIKLKVEIDRILFAGAEINEGQFDAVSLSAEKEFPNYRIFISKKNDATLLMNTDGF